MTDTNRLITQSKVRIIIAISITALLASMSLMVMKSFFKAQEIDASLINQAGRQRMLSQRIALGIHIFTKQQTPAGHNNTHNMIRESAQLILSSHIDLISKTQSPSINALYFNGDPSLDDDIRALATSALSILKTNHINQPIESDLKQFEIDNINYLLFRLNLIVTAYEEEAQNHINNSNRAETFIWLFTLLILLLEYIYIFKPTLRLLRKGFSERSIQNRRMQLAADSAHLGIWEFTIKEKTLYWDKQMWRIFYDSEPQDNNITYERFEQQVHPEDRDMVNRVFQQSIERRVPMDTIFRILTPNKTLRYIQVHSIIEYDHNQKPLKIVGTNQDISEQKHKESALIKAKEKAEEATRIKSDFLASMSHEIRTPLNGVMGMLGLLSDTPLSQLQKQRIDIAQSSAQSLLTLINDILDFSKIEADKLQIESIEFDLNHMLAELTSGLAQQAENKNIELVLDTAKVETSKVIGDPGRIRQLLTNLLANAIKFTHQGHVLLSVALTSYSKDHWQLNFNVEDTGIGISKEKQSLLFNAFSQVDASTTRKYGGTGLGLAIVKRLCIAMNGGINITSEENHGSCFYGSLLLGKSEHANIVSPDVDVSQHPILVVDDQPTSLKTIDKQLTLWGSQVTTANSGQEALQICEQRINRNQPMFDIALIDMQMSHMNGTELARCLKSDSRFSSIHLVMMTSILGGSDSESMANIGACAYFAKPVSKSDLLLALSVMNKQVDTSKDTTTPVLTHEFLSTNTKPSQAHELSVKGQIKQLPNKHILLVEDNAINQLVATAVLEELGFTITVAGDGLDAINILKTQPSYCMIFMDCQMPRMDGFEATRQIRAGNAGAAHTDTVIVALTANTMKGDKQKCLDSGMNDFIPKPIDNGLLERIIASWVLSEAQKG